MRGNFAAYFSHRTNPMTPDPPTTSNVIEDAVERGRSENENKGKIENVELSR